VGEKPMTDATQKRELTPRLLSREQIVEGWKRANDQSEALVRFAKIIETWVRSEACQIVLDASDECKHRARGKTDICAPCLSSALDDVVNRRRMA
jgi:hypothetical protein